MPEDERTARELRRQRRRWAKARAAGDLSPLPTVRELRALVQTRLGPDEQVRFAARCAALSAKALVTLDETLTALSASTEVVALNWDTDADKSIERVSKRFLADLERLQQVRGARKLSQLSVWTRVSRYMSYAERRARELMRHREYQLQAQSNTFLRQVMKMTRGTTIGPVYRRMAAHEHLEELADAAAEDGALSAPTRVVARILRRPESRFQLLLAKLEVGGELCSPEEQRLMLDLDVADPESQRESIRSNAKTPDETHHQQAMNQPDERSTSSSSESEDVTRFSAVEPTQEGRKRRVRRKRTGKEAAATSPASEAEVPARAQSETLLVEPVLEGASGTASTAKRRSTPNGVEARSIRKRTMLDETP
ncbi:hypothetical protein CCYA_CCYA01G0013 [Cyanidiococcus yangmingshanensis]|nr:hypothetical protein CCYA_CCYA01G0013 [Cyanidiococcus yangmingshanensis]